MARTYQHQRGTGRFIYPTDSDASKLQKTLSILGPTPGATITRTRLWLQFRILQYRLTGTGQLTTQWWQDVVPIVGVQAFDTSFPPGESDDPIGGELSDNWIIWSGMVGSLDWAGPDILDSNSVTYVWNFEGGISESFAKRKTTVGNLPSVWLAWNWLDPDDLINRAHGSFPIAYDLSVNFAWDILLEMP